MTPIGILFDRSTHHSRECFRGVCTFARQYSPDWQFHFGTQPDLAEDYTRLSGMIVASRDESVSLFVRNTGVPAVNLSSVIHDPYLVQIWLDDLEIGRMAATHLYQRGFRRWAYFGIPNHYGSQKRREGFVDGLAELGSLPEHLVVDISTWGDGPGETVDVNRLAVALEVERQPIGCFSFEDDRGAQVLNECHKAGIAVPHDVGLISARNDDYLCETTFPTMSSIDIGQRRRGFIAGQVLADMIAGKTIETPVPPVVPVGLVSRESTGPATTQDPMVNQAVAFIQAHIRETVRISDLADHVHTNRRTLEIRFRDTLGCSPHQYILQEKIEEVKQLLLTTDLHIQGITDTAGFRNRAHMSTLFRKMTGQSLMQFRKQAGKPGG